MELMDRIIEIVMEHEGTMWLADALVSELVEWGPINADTAEKFADVWNYLEENREDV